MITTQHSTLITHHGPAEVWFNTSTGHHSLHASKDYKAGDLIVHFSAGSLQNVASYLTVQTGIDQHITLQPDFLQFVNHSCKPNVFFDTSLMQFICLADIRVKEQLCFFYPSTEWKMAQPFNCLCGAENCLKMIQGAAYLSIDVLLQHRLTDFIFQQLKLKQ